MWYNRYGAWTTAKVAQLVLSLCIDEHVFHLYIAMTDSFCVHMLKYACHSYQYLHYNFFVELYALALFQYIEGSPFYHYLYPLLQFSMNKRPYFSSFSAISPQSNNFTTLGWAKSWSIYLDECCGTFIYCMRWRFLYSRGPAPCRWLRDCWFHRSLRSRLRPIATSAPIIACPIVPFALSASYAYYIQKHANQNPIIHFRLIHI